MASYIMLSTLTDEGRKTLKERPERLQAVNKEVEAMGARVRSQYAVLGGYDFVNVIDAPSNEVMARIVMELGARGTIKVTTMPAMPIDSAQAFSSGARSPPNEYPPALAAINTTKTRPVMSLFRSLILSWPM